MNQAEEYARSAVEAAKTGGEVLLRYYGRVNDKTIEMKRVGDWVSEADWASENAIIDFIKERHPGHEILTEESGLIRNSEALRWIIDPLDGTTNFLRKFPVWAVSVALEDRSKVSGNWGEIIAGAIHIPLSGETYWAFKNGGAYLDGKEISVSPPRPFNECLLGTGFPFRTRHLVEPYSNLLKELLARSADARRAGAVAVDLCHVASGVLDGFWELDLSPWDLAAGALLIKEAGGLVCNFQGGDDFLTTGDIVAGSPGIMSELGAVVSNYFPVERKADKTLSWKTDA